jgi:predicted metal-dependent peptidase
MMDEELLKLVIAKNFPLFAPILSKIRIKEDKGLQYPAGLNYREKTIYINPDEFNEYNSKEKMFIIAHEIMHYLLVHDPEALRNKNLLLVFNLVRDAQINHILHKQMNYMARGVITLDVLERMSDKVREYFEGDVEKFLNEDEYFIVKLMLEDEKVKGMVNKMIDALESGNNPDETSKKIKDILRENGVNIDIDEISKNIVKEYNESKELGEMSDEEIRKMVNEGMEMLEKGRLLSKMLNPESKGLDIKLRKKRIKWKEALRQVMSEIGALATDYDLTKLDKKAWVLKTYVPGVIKENESINVIIGIDVSGSISDNEYMEFINEVYNLMSDVKVNGKIVLWDNKIERVVKVENGWNNDILRELKNRVGYGGTIIKEFFNKANELVRNKRNSYLIILTDGEHEKVEREWVKDYKKVVFVISKEGKIENLMGIKDMKNVYITFLE